MNNNNEKLASHYQTLIVFFNQATHILPTDLPDLNKRCDYAMLSKLSERLSVLESRARHIPKCFYPSETSVTLRRLIMNVIILLDVPKDAEQAKDDDDLFGESLFFPGAWES